MQKKHSLLLKKQWFINNKSGNIEDFYQINYKQPVGNGGFGVVYKGRLKGHANNDWRAIKKIPKKKVKSGVQQQLLNQIQILKKLDHPHIVKLYESYQDTQYIYLVTQMCQGGQLFDQLLSHSFTEAEARNIFRQIMLAINYCHSQNVAHRDLKLQNFLYLSKQTNSVLKLIDFGLSFRFCKDYVQNKERKMVSLVGTSYYMAPEVFTGKYDQKCDVWSAGVILYMLIAGQPPFNGQTDQQIMKCAQKMKYTFSEAFNCVSESVKKLIKRMLLEVNKRPTAQQVLMDDWFKDQITSNTLKLNVKSMKSFANFSKFKKIALTLIATQLQEKDILELGKIFKSVDKNNDGILSFEEIKFALQNQKEILQNHQIKQLLQSIDTDHSGSVDYTEFIASSIQHSMIRKQQNIKKAFRVLDVNNDGRISKQQLQNLLERQDYHLTSKSLDEMMKECDLNGDGFIDYQQFLAMIINMRQR